MKGCSCLKQHTIVDGMEQWTTMDAADKNVSSNQVAWDGHQQTISDKSMIHQIQVHKEKEKKISWSLVHAQMSFPMLLSTDFCYIGLMQRISCVHTQILEVGHGHNGAVTALIYYRGLLCSGYADGSIKVSSGASHFLITKLN